MREKVIFVFKFIITVFLCTICSKGIRVIGTIVEGAKEKPSFVTTEFAVYAVLTTVLLVIAYVLLERYLPFRNRFIRGLIFVVLFGGSCYLPQLIGMSGGKSLILPKDAMSVSTIVLDSVGYFISSFIIGGIMSTSSVCNKRVIKNTTMAKACIVSMVLFPAVLGATEFVISLFDKPFLCVNAFGIYPKDKVVFYIVFYSFQAVSGLVFPIFFRFSEYNKKEFSSIRFGCVLGGLLWAPIVLIVMFFGTDILITIEWTFVMFVAILVDTWIYVKIIKKEYIDERAKKREE